MILNRQRAVRIARRPLESFLRRVANELDIRDARVTVCFVSDREIAHMNELFRKKKGPTDVLSFPAEKKRRASRSRRKKTYKEDTENTRTGQASHIAARISGSNGRNHRPVVR